MYRRIAFLLAAVLVLSALPTAKTSAANVNSSPVSHLAQSAPTKCTNTTFITTLTTDFGDFANKVQATDMTSLAALTQTLLSTADLRKKYEDMEDVKGCEDTEVAAFIAFANASDLLALALAAQTDTKNAATYATAITAQGTRFKQTVDDVLVAAGVSTPSATAPTATAPVSCKDATFLQSLGKDFGDFGDQVKATDMNDAASIAKAIISTSAIRRKYEDMNFDTDECLYAQFSIIAAFANGTDVLDLGLALKADPKNADKYNKAVTDQVTRFQQSVQYALEDLGLATPEPDATQAK